MQTDLDKLRPSLQRAIDQGRKIETLTGSEEWQFFSGWLEQAYQETVKAIMNGDFIGQPEREAFNKGMARALRVIIDTAEDFKAQGKKAAEELRHREKQENGEER